MKRGEPLGHILLDGPPGLGKTTFATCIPHELGVSVQIASGAALAAPKDLLPYLTNIEERSVLFIDEIHRMPKAVEEFLYPAMEDFRIDIVLGEGVNARTINLQLKPFTLIGATTRTGLLSAPLRDRFQMREHLDFYSIEELSEIVARNMRKLKVESDDEAAGEIALRSRGTPRLANNRLRWVRDYALSRADGRVSVAVARDGLDMLGIDRLGLDPQDRKYMETIARVFGGGPVGVEAVAHTLNLAPDTLVDEVEPFLLRKRARHPHASRPPVDRGGIRTFANHSARRFGPFGPRQAVLARSFTGLRIPARVAGWADAPVLHSCGDNLRQGASSLPRSTDRRGS